MVENILTRQLDEKRSEPRTAAKRSYTVEIKLSGVPIHQFKLRDISLNGACVVVKEGSSILNHLSMNQILNMKYYFTEKSNLTGYLKTEIKHITRMEEGRFKKHYLVGVSIIEKQNLP